jgi:hypothetical protein
MPPARRPPKRVARWPSAGGALSVAPSQSRPLSRALSVAPSQSRPLSRALSVAPRGCRPWAAPLGGVPGLFRAGMTVGRASLAPLHSMCPFRWSAFAPLPGCPTSRMPAPVWLVWRGPPPVSAEQGCLQHVGAVDWTACRPPAVQRAQQWCAACAENSASRCVWVRALQKPQPLEASHRLAWVKRSHIRASRPRSLSSAGQDDARQARVGAGNSGEGGGTAKPACRLLCGGLEDALASDWAPRAHDGMYLYRARHE